MEWIWSHFQERQNHSIISNCTTASWKVVIYMKNVYFAWNGKSKCWGKSKLHKISQADPKHLVNILKKSKSRRKNEALLRKSIINWTFSQKKIISKQPLDAIYSSQAKHPTWNLIIIFKSKINNLWRTQSSQTLLKAMNISTLYSQY